MTVHPFIEAEKQAGHNVKRACELLKVSRTAFYARRNGNPGPRAVRDAELTQQITAVHERSRGTYGAPARPCRAPPRRSRMRTAPAGPADAGGRTQGPAPRTTAPDHDP